MKIYTKFGDQGKTRLVGGECVDKSNPRVQAYGTVDELNSYLGVAIAEIQSLAPGQTTLKSLVGELIRLQHELFNLGSLLACEKAETRPLLPALSTEHVQALELSIDRMSEELPVLKNFILPGGSRPSAQLHVARTICRRAERETTSLMQIFIEQKDANEVMALEVLLIYLNRMSDYLFVAARFCNLKCHVADSIWEKNNRE